MKKLIYIFLLIPFITFGQTDWHPIDEASLNTFIASSSNGDRMRINADIPTTSTITLSKELTFKSDNGSKITGFKTLTGATDEGGNIWKFTGASTLDSLSIVVIDGINTPKGAYPNLPSYFPVLYNDVSGGKSSELRCVGLTGTNLVGAKIHRKSSFRKIIADVTAHSGEVVNISHSIFAENIDSFGAVFTDHIDVLDLQNEWYYDDATGDLYVYSTSQPTGVQIPTVEDLFYLEASNVSFDDITLEGANAYVLNNNKGATTYNDLTLENCTIQFAGRTGVYVRYDTLLINNSIVRYCNDAGIQPNNTENATVTNTTVHDIGVDFAMLPYLGGGWGINHIDPEGNNVYQYLTIYNTGYSNFMTDPDFSDPNTTTLFDKNYCYSGCHVYSDGALVYTYTANKTDNDFLWFKITNNILINSVGGSMLQPVDPVIPVPTPLIYLDENSANVTIEGNYLNTGFEYAIFFNINDKNITVRDNIISSGSYAAIRINNTTASNTTNFEIKDNIVVSNADFCYDDSWQPAYTELDLDTTYYVRTQELAEPFRNVQPSVDTRTFSEWQSFSGQDLNSSLVVSDVYERYNATMTPIALSDDSIYTDARGNVERGGTIGAFESNVFTSISYSPTGGKGYIKMINDTLKIYSINGKYK